MAVETRPFDITESLVDAEAIAIFLSDALETGDPAYFAFALGKVAKARGMTEIAKETGLSRESLYRALSDTGNPEFMTVLKVVKALGLKLTAEPIAA